MNLLLLLSALLSALTGAVSTVRQPAAAHAVQAAASASVAIAPAAVGTIRPRQAPPTLIEVAMAPAAAIAASRPLAPLYADRRRE